MKVLISGRHEWRPYAAALLAVLSLAGCSPRIAGEGSSSEHRVSRDTVRVVVERRDTVRTGDTLRVFVRERGDTVRVRMETIKWRTRVIDRHDTVWASRTDTVTRVERITVERPREMGDWMWPMATGVMAGAAAALYLFNLKNKSNAEK